MAESAATAGDYPSFFTSREPIRVDMVRDILVACETFGRPAAAAGASVIGHMCDVPSWLARPASWASARAR